MGTYRTEKLVSEVEKRVILLYDSKNGIVVGVYCGGQFPCSIQAPSQKETMDLNDL
jgi:hypothetical protein